MCHDGFDELFNEEKDDFDASLIRKQFPSIMLGQSTPVELYDGISDGTEKSNVLTEETCSELVHTKVVDPNMLYDSWGSVANEFNQFSSNEIESISDKSSPGPTFSPSIFQIDKSSSLKEEISDLQHVFDGTSNGGAVKDQPDTTPFELILDKSISFVPALSKKQCTQLENCGFHTVGPTKISECRYCFYLSFHILPCTLFAHLQIRKLLTHFPRTYADLQNAESEINDGQYLIFVGKVISSRLNI